ncbi:citramalate synthase [Candidatus Bathyarchaeota archaeon]|nr:citramalate synthase [Candidatus Bathyarchaeota archaeon]
MDRMFLYDTTLRDGAQGANISFSANDKIKIVERLDKLGIHYVEAGFAGSNKLDDQVFRQLSMRDFDNVTVSAFGMTRRPFVEVEEDASLNALIKAGTPAVTVVGKSWDRHVMNVLKTTLEENLAMIEDSIDFLKKKGREVLFDAEHFFDGFKHNRVHAMATLEAAISAGADWVILCDTNGGTLPHEIGPILKLVIEQASVPVGVHFHNDSGVATANSLLSIAYGARQVQGTMNGLGERCGNANLTTIIPNLKLKMDFDEIISNNQLKHLREVSNFIMEVANLSENKAHPFTGSNAFVHKGGMHSDAILKDPRSYEHVNPALVGNERKISISDLAGKAAIKKKASELGLDVDKSDNRTKTILDIIKVLQSEGFSYESADASLELLMKGAVNDPADPTRIKSKFFTLERFRVITETDPHLSNPRSEATIKVVVNDKEYLTAAEGNGPVNALDNAVRKSLEYFYPELKEVVLNDYKVRITDQAGTGSKVRVLIESKDREQLWTTVGASENIIWASWLALEDSIVFKLLKELEKKGFSLNSNGS